MVDINKGDVVRITQKIKTHEEGRTRPTIVEGRVSALEEWISGMGIYLEGFSYVFPPSAWTFEVIERAKPEYEPGLYIAEGLHEKHAAVMYYDGEEWTSKDHRSEYRAFIEMIESGAAKMVRLVQEGSNA